MRETVMCPFKSKVVLVPEPHFRWISLSLLFGHLNAGSVHPSSGSRTHSNADLNLSSRAYCHVLKKIFLSFLSLKYIRTFGPGGTSGRLAGSPSGMSSGPAGGGAWKVSPAFFAAGSSSPSTRLFSIGSSVMSSVGVSVVSSAAFSASTRLSASSVYSGRSN